MKESVLITGASGLVGRHLSELFREEGYRVLTLSRNPKGPMAFRWDPTVGFIDPAAFEKIDHIVHLAGVGIGDKNWTVARKKEILESRVASCDLLFRTCQDYGIQLKSFVTASAVGYYGTGLTSVVFTEENAAGKGFLASVCEQWEQAANRFEEKDVRTVKIRTGIVLAADGGILPRMALPVRMGLGTAFGNGKQCIPWIHVQDLCRIYLEAIREANWRGAYNAVAPETATNRRFTKELARLFHKPFWPVSIPAFPLRLMLGQRSELLLKGNQVMSVRLPKTFFQFSTLEGALKDLYPIT